MNAEKTTHHLFSPSSLERRELCPASARLEEGLPSFDTEYSQPGTEKHAKVAALIGAYAAGEESPDETDEDVLKAFKKAKEIVQNLEEPAVGIYAEKPLSYKYCGIEYYRGTADVVIVTKSKLVIIDFKFGHRAVTEAADNSQGAAYALAAMKTFDQTTADVHFYNPVINQFSSHTFTNPQGIAEYIMGVMMRCKNPQAPAIPGETQCRYCKAAYHGTCPALAATVEKTSTKAESLVPLPSLQNLTNAQIVDLKRKCDLVAKLSERIDNRIKAICEAEGSCGPFRLKEVSGGREIPEITEAFKCVDKVFTAEEFLGFCSLSVAKFEKGFASKKKQLGEFKTEKEAKVQFCTELASLIQQKPNRKIIVEA
jgi:hypothetical protein